MERVKKLLVGVPVNGTYVTEVEILKSNGIAERVFTDKLPEKPYTWMGNVLSAALKNLGDEPIGEKCRNEYLNTRSITIPNALLNLSIADVHTLLLEVHRTAWRPVIKKQEAICKYCGTKMLVDIDLNKIEPEEPYEEKVWEELSCDLDDGFTFHAFGKPTDDVRMFDEYDGVTFNRMTFRIPTLRDGIKCETYSDDNVGFWRRIAYGTLESLQAVTDEKVTHELPKEAIIAIGMKLFDVHLFTDDLFKIRETLRETLPILPYFYQDECVNSSCKRMTPVSMEASNFFSD